MKTLPNRVRLESIRKGFGLPRFPQNIEAMYEDRTRGDRTRGNRIVEPILRDPVRDDDVYLKLRRIRSRGPWNELRGHERVAGYFMNNMRARVMGERAYRHIERMPLWFLKLEFAINHKLNYKLRRRIDEELRYMFESSDKGRLFQDYQ